MNRTIRNILSILTHREKKKLQIQILLSTIISFLDIAFIGLILLMVSVYTGELEPQSALIPATLFDRGSLLLVTTTVILFALKNLAAYLITKSQFTFVYEVATRISNSNLQKYFDKDYESYVHTDSSVDMRRVSQEPIEFSHYILSSLQQIITQSLLIIFSIVAILAYNASLFLLLFLLLAPPVVYTARLIRKKLSLSKANAKVASEKNIQYLHESLAAYVESNIYDRNAFFRKRCHTYQSQLNLYLADQQVIQALPARLIEVFATVGFLILILVNRIYDGDYSVSLVTVGVFMAASYKIIPGMVKILNGMGYIHAYNFTIEDLLPETEVRISSSTVSYDKIESIDFTSVAFDYGDKSVLKNFNLEILPGDFIGISGASGQGKTTLINLLLGFLTPQDGFITVNKLPIIQFSRTSVWKRIAYVKQQGFLIHDTILKNITLSEVKPDSHRLKEALRISGTQDLLTQLPNGLNEVIRENGKNLSGGQRQRIIMARALYKDFDLLILDEPLNELDEVSKIEILGELHDIAEAGKMVLLISHDSNGLAVCNKLISLE